jgi:hypothetical protein
VWLIALATGLAGFAVWRLLQAFLDADRQGRRASALAKRGGQAISAVLYGLLAWSALELLDGVEDLRESGGGSESAAAALNLPLGGSLLFLTAAALGVASAGNLLKAASKRFGKELSCSEGGGRLARPLGRAGYAARGLVFLSVGLLLLRTGLSLVSAETDTLGVALGEMEALPFGSALTAAMGLALAGFGAFGLVEARFRRIQAPPRSAAERARRSVDAAEQTDERPTGVGRLGVATPDLHHQVLGEARPTRQGQAGQGRLAIDRPRGGHIGPGSGHQRGSRYQAAGDAARRKKRAL